MRHFRFTTILLVGAIAAWPRTEANVVASPETTEPTEARHSGVARSRTIYVSSTFARSVEWGGLLLEPRDLSVWSNELDPATGQWEQSTVHYSVAFDVVSIGGIGADLLVVAGYSGRFDDEVIELWDLSPSTGGYKTWLSGGLSHGPIGTPSPTSVISEGIEGGLFQVAAGRTPAPAPSRTEIFRGDLGGIIAVAVDPEERFVLVLSDEDDCVYQIDVASGVKQVVLDVSISTTVASADGIRGLEHAVEGRKYIVGDRSADQYVFMNDTDNDGVFDSFLELTRAQILTTDYVDNTLMKDFVNQFGGANF